MLAPWKKSHDKPRQHIRKQRCYFADKDLYSQSYGFSSSHVWMWELDHEEGWALKNWCFWTVVLEKILESPLDCNKIKPLNFQGSPSKFILNESTNESMMESWMDLHHFLDSLHFTISSQQNCTYTYKDFLKYIYIYIYIYTHTHTF